MKSILLLPFVCLIAACGGSSSNPAGDVVPTDDVVREVTENGLPFAASGDTYTDAEGETLKVLIARFKTDRASDVTSTIFSEETVTFEVGGIVGGNLMVTFGDETVAVVDGSGILENEQVIDFYKLVNGVFSGVYTVNSYSSDLDEGIDTEGYFAYGFETNPDTIAAMPGSVETGSVTYSGNMFGYVQELDANNELIRGEVVTNGSIVLTSNFTDQTMSGNLEGGITRAGDNHTYTGIFTDARITGNGFSSTFVTSCDVCADGSGQIEGTFYGDAAQEISGVATFNVAVDGSSYVGASGYVATAD